MSRVVSMFATVLLLSAAVRAQSEPCYCTVMAYFSWSELRWVVLNCNWDCIPGEGGCVNVPTMLPDGTQVRVCACVQGDGSFKAPQCYCSGKVVNPGFVATQQASAVLCESLQACPAAAHKCSSSHLFSFPGFPVEVCKCQG